MKKYELLPDNFTETESGTLYRIRALRDFCEIKKGDLGGYIQSEENLSHEGDCWVGGQATVYEDARVIDNAWVYDSAIISGRAVVKDSALVSDLAKVSKGATVQGEAHIRHCALVSDNAMIFDKACVSGHAQIRGRAYVRGNALVRGNAIVSDRACIEGDAEVEDAARVGGLATLGGYMIVGYKARVFSRQHLFHLGPIGSRESFTTFFRTQDNRIWVICGCFSGSIESFEERVKEKHGDNVYAQIYAHAIQMAKLNIDLNPNLSGPNE